MSGINKVIVLGNLGKDPEVRFMPNGGGVANLTIATSETWKDKQTGEQKEKTEWHRVVMFGKLAEVAGEYLKKGSEVYIEGALQTRKWTNQQGQDQYTTEIVVQGFNGTMQMLDSRGGSRDNSNPNNTPAQQQGGYSGQKQQAPQQQGGYSQPAPQQNQQQGGYSQPAPQQNQQQPGYSGQKQQAPQQQGGFANQGQQQKQSHPKVNPQEPDDFYDDDIPFASC